ncbi:hypothetical protein [Micromonospora sp. CA-246542]|uniref:hypothetical protein n=1 Tax=Micromonospora sp. CA-246542 TaxID=3239959 RepID=UPI003D901206
MAIHSKQSRVLINDAHVSGRVSGWSTTQSRSYGSVTGLLDDGERFVPGLLSGSMTVSGTFDSDPDTLYDKVAAAAGVDNGALITVLPDGFTVGKPALMAVADLSEFDVPASVSEAVTLSVTATADEAVELGVVLHGLQAETAGGNSSSVNNLASTANGGVAALHVSAFSGLTGLTVKVQHSTDGSVWVDLMTFTAATGKTSERKTVAGTVNQYTRALWTVTGTGSATFALAFARR